MLRHGTEPSDLCPPLFHKLEDQLLQYVTFLHFFSFHCLNFLKKIKPFFDCLLGEHCLLCSNPGWQAELVPEDLLDSSHQNVALTKNFVVQLTSCLKGLLLTKRLILIIIFCGSLLSWWWKGLQDNNVLRNSTGSTAQMCSDLCRFDSFLQPSHYLCLFLLVNYPFFSTSPFGNR